MNRLFNQVLGVLLGLRLGLNSEAFLSGSPLFLSRENRVTGKRFLIQ